MLSILSPLHPPIVHFPITLFLLAGLFGFISLFIKREFWKGLMLKSFIGGIIFAPLAVISGLIDEQNLAHNDDVHELMIIHKYNGLAILFFFQILAVWYWFRRIRMGNKEYILWVLCLLAGNGSVAFQGYLGGEMVFGKGAGVKPMETYLDSGGKNEGGHQHNGKKEMMEDAGKKEETDHESMKNMPEDHSEKKMNHMKEKDMNVMKMNDMNGKHDPKSMKDNTDMHNMKTMKKQDAVMDMPGHNMPGMNMESPMDTFKFEDNNPARKKAKINK